MSRTRQGAIYALIDPRDNKIRYIGKTTQPILNRLAGHLAQPTNPAMRVWINSLALQGLTPRIETVTTTTVARLDTEEQRQIHRHAKAGHRLLNGPYYRNHLADLIGQPALPQDLGPECRQGERLEVKVARQLFGRLAAARAERRVPAWTVAALVALGSPLFLALLILRGLLDIKLVRALLFALACALPFWESGFDRAVRDLALAWLPVEEWAALWTEYAAGPLRTLAMDSRWPLLVTSALMAGVAYSEVAKAAEPHGHRDAGQRLTP